MADHSPIEWTDATWNPIVGCSLASPGCIHCYAMAMARRIEAMQPGSHYAGTTHLVNGKPVWTGKVALAPEHILTQPLRWQRPRRIFVNSMGDLFHESVPDAWIDLVFAVMTLCSQHTFQVLTKRTARMREYLSDPEVYVRVHDIIFLRSPEIPLPKPTNVTAILKNMDSLFTRNILQNVWLGCSTEDQRRADERVPDLLRTPATIRFISAEPLLGPLYLSDRMIEGSKIDLVIAGGESGPDARPLHPDWVRSLRDQCAAAGTAFFFKQWGEWECFYDREEDDPDWRRCPAVDSQKRRGASRYLNLKGGYGFHGERVVAVRNVGKRAAGRLLDGVEHNALPEPRP